MAKAPLFSTYRAGENRVTSSMLAVFERIDFSLVESLLSAAAESDLRLLRFANQVTGPESVPDAEISADFRYLFEVKTEFDSLAVDQLRAHLRALDGRYSDERLFALTPDIQEPAAIREIDDERLVWVSFRSLAEAMWTQLETALPSEREAFLLRELLRLLEEEQLLGYPEEVVVVPARSAYDEYLQLHLYMCQAHRSFRAGLSYLGFYRDRRIEKLIPRILVRRQDVELSAANADRLRTSTDPDDLLLADAVERALPFHDEPSVQIFVLSAPDSPETLSLRHAVTHSAPSAWTQNQRYVNSAALQEATTTDDLT